MQERFEHLAECLKKAPMLGDRRVSFLQLVAYKRLSDSRNQQLELAVDVSADWFRVPRGCAWPDMMKSPNPGAALDRAFAAVKALSPCVSAPWASVPRSTLEQAIQLLDPLSLGADIDAWSLNSDCARILERITALDNLKQESSPTPIDIVELMTTLLRPRAGMRVYDPACGSSSMLLAAAGSVVNSGGHESDVAIYGQDTDPEAVKISWLRCALTGIRPAHIEVGDSLDATVRGPGIGASPNFDLAFANLPFSRKLGARTPIYAEDDELHRVSKHLSETSRADLAFVLHILETLAENGRAAVLLPYGALYRSGPEQRVRKYLVEANLVDAVIGLGAERLLGNPIPVALVLLRKRGRNRSQQAHRIVFVDGERGARESRPRRGNRRPLTKVEIAQIESAARGSANKRRSCTRSTDELIDQDSCLSIQNYLPSTSKLGRSTTRGAKRWVSMSHVGSQDPDSRNGAGAPLPAAIELARFTQQLFAFVPQKGPFSEYCQPPEAWALEPLSSLLDEPIRNGVCKPKSALGSGTLYIGQRSISSHGALDLSRARRIKLGERERAGYILRPGDVILKRVNGSPDAFARAAVIPETREPVVFESSIMRIRPSTRIEAFLLLAWLEHPSIRRALLAIAGRSNLISINQRALGSLLCPSIRDVALRRRIGEELRHRYRALWRSQSQI